jgi:hypothetical protein
MEDVYHWLTLRWNKVGRRNTANGLAVEVNGTNIPTFYHSPKEVKKMLSKNYNIELLKPIAIALPPSYLEPFFSKFPTALRILNWIEKILGNFSVLAAWSDHYIVIAERK